MSFWKILHVVVKGERGVRDNSLVPLVFPKVSLLSFMLLHSRKNKIPVSHITPSLSLALSFMQQPGNN